MRKQSVYLPGLVCNTHKLQGTVLKEDSERYKVVTKPTAEYAINLLTPVLITNHRKPGRRSTDKGELNEMSSSGGSIVLNIIRKSVV